MSNRVLLSNISFLLRDSLLASFNGGSLLLEGLILIGTLFSSLESSEALLVFLFRTTLRCNLMSFLHLFIIDGDWIQLSRDKAEKLPFDCFEVNKLLIVMK